MKERIETDNKLVKAIMEPFETIDDFREKIDATVAHANSEITRWKEFDKLFESQIATLIERGVPEPIRRWLRNSKGDVMRHAMEMTLGKWNIPFLPVISLDQRTVYDLMAMIRTTDGKVGYADHSYSVEDVEKTSALSYIFDINDGTTSIEANEKNAEKLLAKQNRFPLTITEVVALCVHTDVLSRIGYISALGSRFGGNENRDKRMAVSAEKNFGGRPKLCWGYVQEWPPHSSEGVPSRDCWPRMKPLVEG
ncbi:MAG: DUF5701 family protein [Candidatus Paceibacterota bacterium]|jgi:hypothetical protein